MKKGIPKSKVLGMVQPAASVADVEILLPSPLPTSSDVAPVKLGRGKYPRDKSPSPKLLRKSVNPLFDLPGAMQIKLLKWMNTITHDDVILQMLEEEGVAGISSKQIHDFYDFESKQYLEHRLTRAAKDARTLINIVEEEKIPFSPATVVALEQEIFRQLASGESETGSIARLGALFLKVRGNLRADEMHVLRREKLKRELQGQIDHALERLSAEVAHHPGARIAFDALRQELATSLAQVEEDES